MSVVMMYVLYVAYGLMNYTSSYMLLKAFPTERAYFKNKWWIAFTMPLYNGINTLIRFIGIINTMTRNAAWQTKTFKSETRDIKNILMADWSQLWKDKK